MGFWGFVKSLFGSKKHNNPRIVVWKNRNGAFSGRQVESLPERRFNFNNSGSPKIKVWKNRNGTFSGKTRGKF